MRTVGTDWRRLPGEAPEAWLARLRAASPAGLAPDQKRRLNALRGQAERRVKEGCRERQPQAGAGTGGGEPLTAVLLSRCKEAIRKMSVAERQQLLLWWLHGMPG
jgi:hypothetical protein